MALTKITGQVVDTTTDLVVGVTTVGGGVSAVDGFFSGIITATGAVAFSTNLTVGGSLSVGGTITYEDVTNVDSVGIITARSNILVGSGITLSPDGDIFFTGIMTGNGSGLTGVANTDVIFTDKITLPDSAAGSINVGLASDLQIYHNSSHSYIDHVGDGSFYIRTKNNSSIYIQDVNGQGIAQFTDGGGCHFYHNNSLKLSTTSSGVQWTGNMFGNDGQKLICGNGADLQIYHTADQNYIKAANTLNVATETSGAASSILLCKLAKLASFPS